jgi:hypothetical protein
MLVSPKPLIKIFRFLNSEKNSQVGIKHVRIGLFRKILVWVNFYSISFLKWNLVVSVGLVANTGYEKMSQSRSC